MVRGAGWTVPLRGTIACALALAALTGLAGAQASPAVQFRADNDGFDFYDGWRSQRPYARWLFARMTSRFVRRSTARELGLTLGVTGPPSLADQVHRKAHEIIQARPEIPIGWETQVRFEPGVIVSARQRWLLFSAVIGGVRLLDASVGAGASVGNVLTNAEASADVRTGLNLSHPWRRDRRRGPGELVASIGVRGQALARNMFVDGTRSGRTVAYVANRSSPTCAARSVCESGLSFLRTQ